MWSSLGLARRALVARPVLTGGRRLLAPAAAAAAATAAAVAYTHSEPAPASTFSVPPALAADSKTDETIENWSSTHSANPAGYFEPESALDVQRILSLMHEAGSRLRIVGSALSPNGLGLSDETMLNLSPHCTAVLSVDVEKRQATVQAGARVREVVEALRPHGLTLQNYASIAEQQIGGFLQVGAHGTGAGVPPVDEQVVRLVLHTPALGALELSESKNPKLFYLAKVGLGWLGVVSEVTLQCVPSHKLMQHTFVETRQGIRERHLQHLAHQHMRYMWIPHTDTVVVVTCDPIDEATPAPPSISAAADLAAAQPLRELLVKASKVRGAVAAAPPAARCSPTSAAPEPSTRVDSRRRSAASA
jgi:L-galactono-1,4-lactone dehydrogenase